MIKDKVQNLIGAWETARTIMSPSSSLLSSEASVHPQLQQLSVLSSRQEFWDCAVCALGFAETQSVNAVDVLANASEDLKANTSRQQTQDFLTYCQGYSSVDEPSIYTAAEVISNVISIADFDPKLLMDFETCYELCHDSQDNQACMTSCLAKKIKTYV